MEKDLETLLSELETAAYNQGYADAKGQFDQSEQCRHAIEEVKQEIRELFTREADDGKNREGF